MDAVGAVGARRKYREAPTPNEAGGGTCMLRRAIIPLTCMFYCRVYRRARIQETTREDSPTHSGPESLRMDYATH